MVAGSAVSGVAQDIGPRFHVVGWLPTLIFVTGVWFTCEVARGGHDGLGPVLDSMAARGPWAAIAALAVSVALGLAIHPFQFRMVRFLEGYWSRQPMFLIGDLLIQHRAGRTRYLRKMISLDSGRWVDARRREAAHARGVEPSKIELLAPGTFKTDTDGENLCSRVKFRQMGFDRQKAARGETAAQLPTQLGNVLRQAETRAGRPYGMDAIVAVPRLIHQMPATLRSEHNDVRTQLDLAVRLVWVFLALSGTSVLYVVGDAVSEATRQQSLAGLEAEGLVLLIGAVSIALARMMYRGAVHAAAAYGAVLETILDLSRTDLMEALGSEPSADLAQERARNREISLLLRKREPEAQLEYAARNPERIFLRIEKDEMTAPADASAASPSIILP